MDAFLSSIDLSHRGILDIPWWILLLLFVLAGALWGAFMTVAVDRLPLMIEGKPGIDLFFPGSRCSSCRSPIPLHLAAPFIGFLFNRGTCRSCHADIPRRLLRYEVVSALLALLAGLTSGFTLSGIGFTVGALFLYALLECDLESRYLPDALTLPFLLTGLWLASAGIGLVPVNLAFFSAFLALLLSGVLNSVLRHLLRSSPIPGGDILLVMGIFAWFGALGGGLVLFTACLLAAILSRLNPFETFVHKTVDGPAIPFGVPIGLTAILFGFYASVSEGLRAWIALT